MAGEWSPTMDATEAIQEICDQEKPHVETITGTIYGDFKAVVYNNQTVRGREQFLIKVQVGEKDYIQLNLRQELNGKVTVRGLLQHRTKEDPLLLTMDEPFWPNIGPVVKWSETMDADKDIQKICDQVKLQVEEMTGMIYREFKAVKYRAQEFGNSSLFKVHVGRDYIHLSVSQSDVIQVDVQPIYLLNGVQQHKTNEDLLIPFAVKY